jgi:DNA-binding Xre family transcriptional regulator
LVDILDKLPEEAKESSYHAYAEQTGLGWQQFWQMLRNKTDRTKLKNLQKVRDYLAPLSDEITPGQVRLYLDEIIEARGLTQTAVSEESGVNYVTINRMANNLMRFIDYSVLDRLYLYLELDSLDDLLDTGGLLVWREDEA